MANALIQNCDVLNEPTYANEAFIPLAYEAGLHVVIASLATLALPQSELLLELKAALVDTNLPLAAALTAETLAAFMDYMLLLGLTVVPATELPATLDENGATITGAGRDSGDPTQLNYGITAHPTYTHYRVYLDGVRIQDVTGASNTGTIFNIYSPFPSGEHTLRVLFVNNAGAQTRFGNVWTIPA